MDRAYSFLEIKAVDEDARVIEGIASTPTADRMGDIVEPMGAKFALPMPLLWQHDSHLPIGQVEFAKPTPKGIPFKASILHPDKVESETLKERLREAWDSIKNKLVRAVSIGFRDLSHEVMKDGGWRFTEWEWLELSAVTIPANADATITTIKSLDHEQLAASGRALPETARREPPEASGATKAVKAITPKSPQEGKRMPKTIAEQISAFEATREAKSARMAELMTKAADEGVTLDAEQEQEYDTLSDEVKSVDAHLVRLRDMDKINAGKAALVEGKNQEEGSRSRVAALEGVRLVSQVPKGIAFTRLLGAKYLARQHQASPIDIARSMWPDMPELETVLRTAVTAGTTTDTTNAAPLVVYQNMASEFVDLLRAATIIGRIPGLRRVPFNIKVPRATGDPSVNWVGEGKVKPVSALAFDSIELGHAKVAGIVPITMELMKFSNPAAEGLIRDALIAAIAYLTDRDFLDPTKALQTGVSPASVTNGVTPVTATGATADALRDDLGSLLVEYLEANMSISGLVLVMTAQQALRISLMRNSLGQKEFPDMGIAGGTLEGIPVITSENIVGTGGSPTDGGLIVALNAPEILLADDGGVDIDVSTEASIHMETTPDSPATASTVLTSLWQHNMVGIRAERMINWIKRRSGAVQFIQNAKYQ
jgi:HK97 family phage major capsid protein/HK97 family phage prohead protease